MSPEGSRMGFEGFSRILENPGESWELCKQEIELFLSLPGFGSTIICSNGVNIDFQNRKWNYPNRKWIYPNRK